MPESKLIFQFNHHRIELTGWTADAVFWLSAGIVIVVIVRGLL